MFKFFLLLIFSVLSVLGMQAKEEWPYRAHGHVEDAFTHVSLDSVSISLLRSDSSEVSHAYSYYNDGQNFILKAQQAGRYILRFVKTGYEILYYPINLKFSRLRLADIDLGTIRMTKEKTKKLKEAVVRATRIKMVMHGDTTVYDALAFKLAQGSMLDALVRMLPGVGLTNQGQIKVNGRTVSSLLVNGENFFSGDPTAALQNLPAYTVSKIRVYDQTSDVSQALGLEEHGRKPLVMDVNLKREYSIGWLVNTDAGFATQDRYTANLLGMRFSNHSRLYLFGKMNNTNDAGRPNEHGDWSDRDRTQEGLSVIKKGGVSLIIRDRRQRFYVESNLTAEHRNEDNRSATSGTRFLTGGDVYSRSRQGQRNTYSSVGFNGRLSLSPKLNNANAYITLQPSVDYRTYNNKALSRYATFSSSPYETYRSAVLDSLFDSASQCIAANWINRQQDLSQSHGHSLYGNLDFSGNLRYNRNTQDLIEVSGGTNYRDEVGYSHRLTDLRYHQTPAADDLRRQYAYQPLKSFNYNGKAAYKYVLYLFRCHTSLKPYYQYTSEYRHGDRQLYRLERIGGSWATTDIPLNALPSTTDSLSRALDVSNSYYSASRDQTHKPGLLVSLYRTAKIGYSDDFNASLDLPIRFLRKHLDYTRNVLDTLVTRSFTLVEPSLTLDKKLYEDAGQRHQRNISFSYRLSMGAPSLTSMLPVRDDASPLFVREGNANLRSSTTHVLSAGYRAVSTSCSSYLTANLDYRVTTAAFCQAVTYDRATGVTTYRPDNINGNWDVTGNFNLSRTLDKKKRVNFTSRSSMSYNNSVDRTNAADNGGSDRSTVHHIVLSEYIRISYSYFSLSSDVKGLFAGSHRQGFTAVHCADFTHTATVVMPLPLKWQLSTDLSLTNRRGYQDRSMNTDRWVWNARLSKSLLHGALQMHLIGCDLLGQLSPVARTLNAQGRAETWHNAIPQYVMLHLAYRLQMMPKKKSVTEQ